MEGAKPLLRNLQRFTESIHRAGSVEKERELVTKELASIREDFKKGRLNASDRRRDVLKMIYMKVLGYDVDTGFVEVIQLVGSPKFQDKHVGYLAFVMIFANVPESTRMVINTLQTDLENQKDVFICEALSVITQLANEEMAESLTAPVMRLCTTFTETEVKKKALIALRQLYIKQPSILDLDPDFLAKLGKTVSIEMDLSIVGAVVLFLEEVMKRSPELVAPFAGVLNSVFLRLVNREYLADVEYHDVAAPWLQVRLVRLLPQLGLDAAATAQFWDACGKTLQLYAMTTYEKPCPEKSAQLAVVFEVMAAVVRAEHEALFPTLLPLLSALSEDREVNVRYLALDTFVLLGQADYKAVCQKYLLSVLKSLDEPDVTIRRRAVDVLFALCTPQSVRQVVNHLLHLLEIDEGELREELVVKISLLAEMDSCTDEWYVDTMLLTVCMGGEFLRPELWDRILKSVSTNAAYAVKKIAQVLGGGCWHEEFLRMACVIFGEHADCLGDLAQPMAHYIAKQLVYVSVQTRPIIFTALAKICKDVAAVRPIASKALHAYITSIDPETQQRAAEFLYLLAQSLCLAYHIKKLPHKLVALIL